MHPQIIDANINRVSEGLRVIEEYARFCASDKAMTAELSRIRKAINQTETPAQKIAHLNSRNTQKDARAKDTPAPRKNIHDLLKANFKRVGEGLRVLEEYTGNAIYSAIRYDVYDLEKEILLTLLKKQIAPGIYLISDQVDVLLKGLKLGVSLIQLRDKFATKSVIFDKAKALLAQAKSAHIPVIINDHIDIAIALDADGVHTGQDDIPVPVQRQLLGPHKLIGRTTHTLAQGLAAQKDGADYVSVGPIWETPSKPGRKGIGFEYLKKAESKLKIPYVAIGGVHLQNVDEILPYHPPLIGVVRAYEEIQKLQQKSKGGKRPC